MMKVTCVLNQPAMLADDQRDRTVKEETTYPLTVGREYLVLGMTITQNIFDFLVREDWGGPLFAPAGMFGLITCPVPQRWSFGLRSGIRASGKDLWTDPVAAIWGYAELVNDVEHAGALEEQDPEALVVFAARFADAESEAGEDA